MFNILTIPDESPDIVEQMGTKYKFWYTDRKTEQNWLFKEGRPETGENWAEKLAAELAELLGVPHAIYEFARYRDKQGVTSPTFVPVGAQLIHGNQLVLSRITVQSENDNVRYFAERNHTAQRVLQYLELNSQKINPPREYISISGIETPLDIFIGYLMLDTWIANQDRHSENWGIIVENGVEYLAPSYDHGSSMGRNETDARRNYILTTKDKGSSMPAYVAKARSALYPPTASDVKVKAMFTLDLFEHFMRARPNAGNAWLQRLRNISTKQVENLIKKIPEEYMSEIARKFTLALLVENQRRLLAIQKND